MKFNNQHLLKSFDHQAHRHEWWSGRLVKIKKTINTLYINTPPEDEIGIVVEFQETSVGQHVKVYFTSFNKSTWVLVTDVYTQEEK